MEPNTSFKSIAGTAACYFFYAFIAGSMALCITWEALHTLPSYLFGEDSVLESLQVMALFFTMVCTWAAGRQDTSKAPVTTLLVGAAAIAGIREFDFCLDRYLFDGAWQVLVLLTGALAIVRAFQDRDALKAALHDFSGRPSFGLMAGGFITVFVFSRIFGRQVLWRAIMGDGYLAVVKNAAEEGVELLGYTLIFVGSLEFLRESRCSSVLYNAIDHLR
ncbi:hypothetical protein [Desulfoluna spongiiphila]|uniref:Uncharacterized protein n=1 Tax=Desulfoluna spongiiphila TaxID=419481 RepID=A0A1G5EH66_9BACT|nr:hypothetical protein [Desulfoluna spongiiphila]SCY26312.1 hypothetical protein SAMN05216233_10616 [Desulfoluna spongiiphila]VVS91123.1 hypothetical protein DBB_6910 [Desulfoluna spongiiphila]